MSGTWYNTGWVDSRLIHMYGSNSAFCLYQIELNMNQVWAELKKDNFYLNNLINLALFREEMLSQSLMITISFCPGNLYITNFQSQLAPVATDKHQTFYNWLENNPRLASWDGNTVSQPASHICWTWRGAQFLSNYNLTQSNIIYFWQISGLGLPRWSSITK